MDDTAVQNTLEPGHWARETPDKAAIVMVPSGETVTYRELDERANQLSHYLRSVGLDAGDHIAFSIENRADFMVVCGAATTPACTTQPSVRA